MVEPHIIKDLGLNPWVIRVPLHVLSVSAWVLSKFSGFLTLSKDMCVRLIGELKLTIVVNMSVNCLSLNVLSVMDWRPVQMLQV